MKYFFWALIGLIAAGVVWQFNSDSSINQNLRKVEEYFGWEFLTLPFITNQAIVSRWRKQW